tara:strand:- start:424 stop:603 length:180 start_codon:yes stop_codon:yes gene_type:complete
MKNFSSIYYPNLDPYQAQYNDIWFNRMLSSLTLDGILFIPDLNKSFNKKGEEVNDNFST